MNLLNITTNWTGSNELSKCSISYNASDFQGFNEEDLNASNCVQLTRQNSTDPAQISVSLLEPKKFISRLILISQSKRIEVSEGTFENPGSYIKTISGEMSEDSDDDFKVYNINYQVEKSKSYSQLNIKLTGIVDSCWILNIIIVSQPKCQKTSEDRFDLSNLNPDLALSDNAKDFKKLFEAFQNTTTPNMMTMLQPPNPEILTIHQPPNSELLKSMMANVKNTKDQNQCEKCCDRVEILEKKVLARLDDQDAKLDQILNLLKK